jgi:ADP-sugar diphosphatase
MEEPYLRKTNITIRGNEVEFVFNARLTEEQFRRFEPFWQWCRNLDDELALLAVDVQAVTKFGGRIAFMTIEAFIKDKLDNNISTTVFLRGPSVVILMILRDEFGDPFVVLTRQARPAVGRANITELIAGTLDGSKKITGRAIKEVEEETGLVIEEQDLFDLVKMIYGPDCPGITATPGASDELFLPFACVKQMTREKIESMNNLLAGLREEHERIIVLIKPLLPISDLVKELPDSKSLMTLMLFDQVWNQILPRP